MGYWHGLGVGNYRGIYVPQDPKEYPFQIHLDCRACVQDANEDSSEEKGLLVNDLKPLLTGPQLFDRISPGYSTFEAFRLGGVITT